MMMNKIALGTAQLGSNYGIAFTAQKITSEEFGKIMVTAQNNGITSLDTAIGYGDSQSILGDLGVRDWSITTKLPSIPSNTNKIDAWYHEAIQSVLRDLQVTNIDTLLLHNSRDLIGDAGFKLRSLLLESRDLGLVKKIGVSIYEPEEITSFYNAFRPDVIQCPYNVFDQRISSSGWLARLRSDDVEVHVRSVFLQGIILRDPSELDSYFSPWLKVFSKFSEFCESLSATKLETALAFVKAEASINKIIVGVEGLGQFEEILSAYQKSIPKLFYGSCEDKGLVNPLMWEIGEC